MLLLLRWRLRQKRMKMLAGWKGLVRAVQIRLLQLQPSERLAYVLPLMVLATQLVSCAAHLPPSNAATNPQPPRLSEPLPSESYSLKAQKLIESWLQRVTGM